MPSVRGAYRAVRSPIATGDNAGDWPFGSEVMQVLGDVPVRDPGPVALGLEALDGEERLDGLRAERAVQDRVGLESFERRVERHRQGRADQLAVGAVGITVDRRRRGPGLPPRAR